MALYFIGADKEVLQGEIMRGGAVPAAVRLCNSSHPEVQAEAADVLKVGLSTAQSRRSSIDVLSVRCLQRQLSRRSLEVVSHALGLRYRPLVLLYNLPLTTSYHNPPCGAS